MEKCGKKKMWIAKKVKRIKRETQLVDCKTVGFFLKISKEIGKAWRKNLTRAKRASLTRPSGERKSVSPQSRSLFSASFQTFCLTARAYLNTQKYGLFCSLLLFCLMTPTIFCLIGRSLQPYVPDCNRKLMYHNLFICLHFFFCNHNPL